ncbi:extracellular solute-binding protein [Paenibacillus oralis]|uniref:Extracellular solute-binding protein n=1 Tax=Paenibacillus oralis TaxID=2490856 RepID=A0A3P3TVL3_9BACL|nr:extracellular solute-binding protein [Paenibacillus oralis]RRJ62181.1 extracellular solute-binding protein [Paenibacillus oralis]
MNGVLQKAVLVLASGLLLAGCAGGPAKEAEQMVSLKVMYRDEASFNQDYGELFAMKHPNIKIEVVSTDSRGGTFADFIEKEQPDVLLLSEKQYEKFASEGKLADLDPLIVRDKYNTETIFPGLLEVLKERGGGKLYGLSPTFDGSVLYYNADLFAEYGIEEPHDGMTWQEVLDTARRFPSDGVGKNRVYGFGGADYGMPMKRLASNIASTLGLEYINKATMELTINTDAWKQVYTMAMNALDSKAIYNRPDEDFLDGSLEAYESQPFVMGRMAMTTDSLYFLQSLKNAQEDVKFQVGVVAGPVDPAEPDKTRDFSLGDIFAIRANSANADAAWEFLKFMNGEEFAKIRSRTISDGLMSRMGIQKEYNGVNLDVFYKLKPKVDNDDSDSYDKIPDKFYEQYRPVFDREMKLVEEKKKSIDEALQTIQDEGQAALDKAVQDEAAGKKDKSGADTDQAG